MSVENEKEIQQLKNRIRELADKSYNQNQYTFTGFLGLAEQDALWQVEREVKFAEITLYGGREEAERKILRFGSEAELGYEQPFPICCIRIRPLSAKSAPISAVSTSVTGVRMLSGMDNTRCSMGLWINSVIRIVRPPHASEDPRQICPWKLNLFLE